MSDVSKATIKRLFAVSGNRCAFPGCPLSLVDSASGKVTGRICHIKARKPKGPRYDAQQSEYERHSFENLLLLCPVHHDVVDSDEGSYTVARLYEIKSKHEAGNADKVDPSDNIAQQFLANVIAEVQQKPFVILEPVQRTHGGNLVGLKMKNVGNETALNISVESEPDSATVPFLAQGETCLLRIETAFHQGKPPILTLVDNEYNLFLDPTSAKDTVVFTIRFQNIKQQPYFVEERIGSSGLEIIRSGRAEDHERNL